MNIATIIDNVNKNLRSNAPSIFTGVAVAGVGVTAVLTAKASFSAIDKIRDAEEGIPLETILNEPTKERVLRRTKLVWTFYVPPAVAGAATVAAIVGSHQLNTKRLSAAMAAYSLSDTAFREYREKVVEEIGKNKEEKVRDAIAQEKVEKLPPTDMIVMGQGDVLCCDLMSMRYFKSDMEKLRRAENTINAMLLRSAYVTLDDFYDEIGVWHTDTSSRLGWVPETLMELDFTTTLTPDNQPCLAFRFNYINPL